MYRSETIFVDSIEDMTIRKNALSNDGLVMVLGTHSGGQVYIYADDVVWEQFSTRLSNLIMALYMDQMEDDTPDTVVDLANAPVGEIPRDFDPDWVELDEDGIPVPNDDSDYMKEIL